MIVELFLGGVWGKNAGVGEGEKSDIDIQGVPKKRDLQKISYPKLSTLELNWVRLIQFSKKRAKKHFQTQGVLATGD